MNTIKRDFYDWMAQVEYRLDTILGICSLDLPDQSYWDMWNCGVSPTEAAKVALEGI